MNKPWQNKLIDIEPYVAGEQPKSDDIIKLNANENPYPPSPAVKKALENFNYENLKKYPSINAARLREALAESHGVKAENVFTGNGSDDVLATAFRAFFNSDKPIAYPDITYSFYPVWCELLNIPYKTYAVDENFRINVTDYYGENGGVVIPNPNAPTSIGEGREFIADLLEHNKDCIVIIDEAYADFGKFSAIPLINEYDNLVVTRTFSKSHSMAGMRIAAAFANSYLIKYLDAVKDSYNSYPVDCIAIETAIASVKDEQYFKETTNKIIATRERTAKALKELGFDVAESSTNFLFAEHKDKKAKDIFEYLKTQKIFVRYFNKERIDNRLRITIGTDEQMDKLIKALKEYL
ncbi:MAG: histidinol-phosphate transaminase [Oscillospiraceae bacterium]